MKLSQMQNKINKRSTKKLQQQQNGQKNDKYSNNITFGLENSGKYLVQLENFLNVSNLSIVYNFYKYLTVQINATNLLLNICGFNYNFTTNH